MNAQCTIHRRLCRLAGGLALLLGSALTAPGEIAAAPLAGASALRAAAQEASIVEPVRAGAVRGARGGAAVRGPRGGVAVRGPRGGVAVGRGHVGGRGVVGVRGGVVRPYRAWVRRPYYGTIVGGVALGTIIAVSAIPAAPADNLCWYWSNQSQTRGYWDYCN
jgi:hypothetical protein